MRLVDPKIADFNTIYNQFRWSIPDRLNIAIQVCDRHQSEPDRIAVYYENNIRSFCEYTNGSGWYPG